jgi:benzoate/toluate 1,2-dioxygenase subunit alpha
MRQTKNRYGDSPEAVRALVRETAVHRDVYINQEIFDLEMEHLFANTWVHVGHASQIPNAGDYFTTSIGSQPIIMVRHTDGTVQVLYNRCPHKGTKIAIDGCGNTGKFFRCPYHAWTFRTDGSLLAIPLKKGYDQTGFESSEAARGMTPVKHVHNYRDFVFAKLNDAGPDFATYFGDSLSSLDNMIDRSPAGALVVAGGVQRYMHNCNWKMLVENQTDTCHPMVAHESSAGTAVDVWKKLSGGVSGKRPMAVEMYAPFMSPYEFFESMGIRIWDNGHGHTGVSHSIHSDYSAIPGYFEAMAAAYGEVRAKAILDENRHNTVYFPNVMIKGPIQLMRIFRPLAPDKTLVESYAYRLVGAPDALLERTLVYNRLINGPTSIVGHDDLEVYARAQEGLHANGNEWVNLQRLYNVAEASIPVATTNGTTEWQMRNQFRAWAKYVTLTMGAAP